MEALLRALLEAVPDDAVEAGRDVLIRDREVRRVLLEDRGHRLSRRVPVERAAPGEHLVEDRAEGEDVRTRVGGLALDLLGRHVAERAEHDPRLGPRRGRRQIGARTAFLDVRELGQAEVEDLHAPVARHEEVLGLQVPVDDPLLVRRREAVRDLQGVVDGLARREPPGRERRPQRLALEELLDDVRRAVVGADVVHGREVGMVQNAGCLRLLLEAAQPVGVLRERRRKDLDGHVAAEPRVLRAIHLPHPARAERGQDLVGAQTGSGCQGQAWGRIQRPPRRTDPRCYSHGSSAIC